MSFIAFPLRFQNAFLQRTGEVESVIALIRLMAATPSGSWAGCSDFGVRDVFEGARMQPDAARVAAEKMNRALEELEIRSFRIAGIVKEPATERDVDSYTVMIVSTADESKSYSIALNP
jgi:hypothetical protein